MEFHVYRKGEGRSLASFASRAAATQHAAQRTFAGDGAGHWIGNDEGEEIVSEWVVGHIASDMAAMDAIAFDAMLEDSERTVAQCRALLDRIDRERTAYAASLRDFGAFDPEMAAFTKARIGRWSASVTDRIQRFQPSLVSYHAAGGDNLDALAAD